MPPFRQIQVTAVTALIFTLGYFFLVPVWSPRHDGFREQNGAMMIQTSNITLDAGILMSLDAPAKFNYQRICINAREKRGMSRQSVIRFPHEILDYNAFTEISEETVDLETGVLLPPCYDAHNIDVPSFTSPQRANTAELMLGVATTLKKIRESMPTFSRWLSDTGSPLVCLLVDQSSLEDKKEDTEKAYSEASALGIELILEPYHGIFEHDSDGLKNFGLATVLDKHRREETRWYGIIDDDTFFLSLPRMLDALEPYDPEQMWYMGALAESHTRMSQEGFKAWGGAGFFVSPPLMQALAENAVECTPLDKSFGDLLWRDCILEVTSPTVQLTELRGLNQMDMWKDLSGWYEAGLDSVLTVHHWDSWHHFPIAISHLVADVAGPDSLLQRYQFGNHTVFTNGYSMVDYPNGVPDLNLVELTMTEDVNVKRPPEQLEFHHSMGHTRPALQVGKEKISWECKHAVKTPDETVRQFYLKRNDQDFSLIEIDWRHV